MNDEAQPEWGNPSWLCDGDWPLTFVGTFNGVDIYKSFRAGRFVTQWHKHTKTWGNHEIFHTWDRIYSRRYRAVQKHLRILEALMR